VRELTSFASVRKLSQAVTLEEDRNMIRATVFVLALVALANAQEDGVALLISGFQGGVSQEVVTEDAFCINSDTTSDSVLPNLPAGQVEGGNSEFVDGKVWSCCGANTNQYSDCYTYTVGDAQWVHDGNAVFEREYGASLVFNGEFMLLGGYNTR
jgi:hypothetical protein